MPPVAFARAWRPFAAANAGKPRYSWHAMEKPTETKHGDGPFLTDSERIEQAGEESFPASDLPCHFPFSQCHSSGEEPATVEKRRGTKRGDFPGAFSPVRSVA